MDIELAVDAMEMAEHVDLLVLFSGDGDFRSSCRGHSAQGRPGRGGVDDIDPTADGRRRTAATGRRVHRFGPANSADRSRPWRAAGAGGEPPAGAICARPAAGRRAGARIGALQAPSAIAFDVGPSRDCAACPRLVEYRDANRAAFPDWSNAPVPSFGKASARLLIVGLAPGLRGANRTGRPFTGDYAGDLLYADVAAVRLRFRRL